MRPEHFDRAEDAIDAEYEAGRMSRADYDHEMRELGRDYQAAAEEAAQDAYDRERSEW